MPQLFIFPFCVLLFRYKKICHNTIRIWFQDSNTINLFNGGRRRSFVTYLPIFQRFLFSPYTIYHWGSTDICATFVLLVFKVQRARWDDRFHYSVLQLVAGSVVMAFEEVCPDRIDLIHKNYRKLCNLLVDVEEWGQVVIISMLTRYARTQFTSPWKEVWNFLQCGNNQYYCG